MCHSLGYCWGKLTIRTCTSNPGQECGQITKKCEIKYVGRAGWNSEKYQKWSGLGLTSSEAVPKRERRAWQTVEVRMV